MRSKREYQVVLGPRHDDMVCECYHVKAYNKDEAKSLAKRHVPASWMTRECVKEKIVFS